MQKTDTPLELEDLSRRISELVLERQELRSASAAGNELERNRRELVHCQWKLADALIERHRPGPGQREAA